MSNDCNLNPDDSQLNEFRWFKPKNPFSSPFLLLWYEFRWLQSLYGEPARADTRLHGYAFTVLFSNTIFVIPLFSDVYTRTPSRWRIALALTIGTLLLPQFNHIAFQTPFLYSRYFLMCIHALRVVDGLHLLSRLGRYYYHNSIILLFTVVFAVGPS